MTYRYVTLLVDRYVNVRMQYSESCACTNCNCELKVKL